MTTAEQLLGLACAVYPYRQWPAGKVSPNGFPVSVYGTTFNPADNAEQFCDVLAWLTQSDNCRLHIHGGIVVVTKDYVGSYPIIHYDGTASGLRQAVTDAAVRVCMGVKP